jgi:hypothetical protein
LWEQARKFNVINKHLISLSNSDSFVSTIGILPIFIFQSFYIHIFTFISLLSTKRVFSLSLSAKWTPAVDLSPPYSAADPAVQNPLGNHHHAVVELDLPAKDLPDHHHAAEPDLRTRDHPEPHHAVDLPTKRPRGNPYLSPPHRPQAHPKNPRHTPDLLT